MRGNMLTKRRHLLSGIMLITSVFAQFARATPLNYTFTGTVATTGVPVPDIYGLFGPIGGNLAGDPYTLVLSFDTTAGMIVSTASEVGLNGGVVSASITIHGATLSEGPSDFSSPSSFSYVYAQGGANANRNTFTALASGVSGNINFIMGNSVNSARLPFSTSPGSWNFQSGDSTQGLFQYAVGGGTLENLALNPMSLSSVAAVPLTPSACLFLSGLIALPAVSRRKRSQYTRQTRSNSY